MRSGAQATPSRSFVFRRLPGLPLSFRALRAPSPARLWTGIFIFWTLLISGIAGSPGIQQSIRLKSLLSAKETQVHILQDELKKLQLDAEELEKNRNTQHREIRRILGYSAPDEIIFDFSSGERL